VDVGAVTAVANPVAFVNRGRIDAATSSVTTEPAVVIILEYGVLTGKAAAATGVEGAVFGDGGVIRSNAAERLVASPALVRVAVIDEAASPRRADPGDVDFSFIACAATVTTDTASTIASPLAACGRIVDWTTNRLAVVVILLSAVSVVPTDHRISRTARLC
jgi:hypothetical protein